MARKAKKPKPLLSDAWLDKEVKGKFRHRTAVRCIKPWPGKYRPRMR